MTKINIITHLKVIATFLIIASLVAIPFIFPGSAIILLKILMVLLTIILVTLMYIGIFMAFKDSYEEKINAE